MERALRWLDSLDDAALILGRTWLLLPAAASTFLWRVLMALAIAGFARAALIG